MLIAAGALWAFSFWQMRQIDDLVRGATFYALNHPALAGRTLGHGKTLVELEEEFDREQGAEKGEKAPGASE